MGSKFKSCMCNLTKRIIILLFFKKRGKFPNKKNYISLQSQHLTLEISISIAENIHYLFYVIKKTTHAK